MNTEQRTLSPRPPLSTSLRPCHINRRLGDRSPPSPGRPGLPPESRHRPRCVAFTPGDPPRARGTPQGGRPRWPRRPHGPPAPRGRPSPFPGAAPVPVPVPVPVPAPAWATATAAAARTVNTRSRDGFSPRLDWRPVLANRRAPPAERERPLARRPAEGGESAGCAREAESAAAPSWRRAEVDLRGGGECAVTPRPGAAARGGRDRHRLGGGWGLHRTVPQRGNRGPTEPGRKHLPPPGRRPRPLPGPVSPGAGVASLGLTACPVQGASPGLSPIV